MEYPTAGLSRFPPDQAYLHLFCDAAVGVDDLETARLRLERLWNEGWPRKPPASRLWLATADGLVLLRQERWREASAWAEARAHEQAQPLNLVEIDSFVPAALFREIK